MELDSEDEWIHHGTASVRGRQEPVPYVMRFVKLRELDTLFRLHHRVVSGVSHPHVFRADSRGFMEQQIERRGRTVGIFCRGDIVAYAAISFPDDDADNLGRDLPLPASELHHVADYDGSAVDPDYRGNNFQKLMTDVRHRYALLYDRNHIFGTVFPHNIFSLANFLALGCRVRNLKQKYGGMLRFLIYRNLRDSVPPVLDPHSFVDIPLGDIDRHLALLQKGFQGFRVVQEGGEACLRYGWPEVGGRSKRMAAAS
jgi:hypothetical protein